MMINKIVELASCNAALENRCRVLTEQWHEVRKEKLHADCQKEDALSAHNQLLKYTKELESKLSRKGKRGK
jgi:hypothetical protein